MIYPVRDYYKKWYIAQGFGDKTNYGYHEGLDVNLKTGGNTDYGKPIYAIADGEVVAVQHLNKNPSFGNHIWIKHDGKWGRVWCHYAHCRNILFKVGDKVSEGQKVATIGKSGTKTSHLHWAISLMWTGTNAIARSKAKLKEWTNPEEFIEKWVSDIMPPDMKNSWIKEYLREKKINIENEGESREKLGKIFDDAKKFTELEKRIKKLENSLAEKTGDSVKYEELWLTSQKQEKAVSEELARARSQIAGAEKQNDRINAELKLVRERIDELEAKKGGEDMAKKKLKVSLPKTLIKEDYVKWGRNALIFAGPALLVLLASLLNQIPEGAGWGALAVYLISTTIDLLKKWLSENKY